MADITEHHAFASMIDSLHKAQTAARSLGLLRSDRRWIAIAGMMDQCEHNVKKLYERSARAAAN